MKKWNEIVIESKFLLDDWNKWDKLAMSGKVSDQNNPIFQFQMIPTALLKDFISGKYNVIDIMKIELDKRK